MTDPLITPRLAAVVILINNFLCRAYMTFRWRALVQIGENLGLVKKKQIPETLIAENYKKKRAVFDATKAKEISPNDVEVEATGESGTAKLAAVNLKPGDDLDDPLEKRYAATGYALQDDPLFEVDLRSQTSDVEWAPILVTLLLYMDLKGIGGHPTKVNGDEVTGDDVTDARKTMWASEMGVPDIEAWGATANAGAFCAVLGAVPYFWTRIIGFRVAGRRGQMAMLPFGMLRYVALGILTYQIGTGEEV